MHPARNARLFTSSTVTIFGGLAAVVLGTAGCASLSGLASQGASLGITPPSVTFTGATLARAPGQRELAAYYCPDVVSVPLGGARPLCQGFFGARPRESEMIVAFDLRFTINNPNNIPLPLASVLTAVTVFPAVENQRLGAVCVQLCPPDQPNCNAQQAATACEASGRDIRSLSDFPTAATNLLLAAGLSTAARQPLTFTAPQIAAASSLDVTVRFSFGPEQLLTTMRRLADQSVDELRRGQRPTFSIPYRLEGTVFFDAGSLGRVAVPYGPTSGTWVLPTERI